MGVVQPEESSGPTSSRPDNTVRAALMQLGRTQVSAMELQPTCASAAGLYSSYEAGAPAPSRATSADTRPLDMLRELLL